jgi:hypothetical protein
MIHLWPHTVEDFIDKRRFDAANLERLLTNLRLVA